MNSFFDYRKIIIGMCLMGCMIRGATSYANDITPISSSQIGYAKFAKGTCTEYAASRRRDIFPSRTKRPFGGNAVSRLGNAKRVGFPTGSAPKQGAIAVFAPGRGASAYGHVAIVEKIIDHSTILISEMNYAGVNIVTRRKVPAGLAMGYIYTLPSRHHRTDVTIQKLSTPQLVAKRLQHGLLTTTTTDNGIAPQLITTPDLPGYVTISEYGDNNQTEPSHDPWVPLMALIGTETIDNKQILKRLSEHQRVDISTGYLTAHISHHSSIV